MTNNSSITYKIHPAAELFPLMTGDELKELAADIKKNGQIVPVVRDKDGLIMDGRNRLNACKIADRAPVFFTYTGNDPVGFIVSANIRRRHLTPAQKQELLIKVIALNPEKSDRQIAKTAGVDHKTVGTARKKGEDMGKIPHVAKRTDTKGRKRFVAPSKPKPKSVALAEAVTAKNKAKAAVNPAAPPKLDPSAKALADSTAALANFLYAVDHWVPKLNADDLKKARAHFEECAGKTNGARATGSAEQSVEERRALMAGVSDDRAN